MKDMDMHVLRNPWGHSDDRVREARLRAAEEIDRLRAELRYAIKALDSVATEAERLVPPCTSDEIWHSVVYIRVKARCVLAEINTPKPVDTPE